MKRSNYTKAKVLILIPIIVLAVTVICMVLAAMFEVPSGSRGLLYTIFTFAGLMSMFITPLPCLVISIAGTVFAVKAAKEGASGAWLLFILGIIEILVYVVGVILAVILFVTGQGV